MNNHRSYLGLLVVALFLAWTAGCADSSEPQPGGDAQGSVDDNGLRLPAEGARVPQNDTSIGCDDNATRGRGFVLSFAWSEVAGAAAYHLYVIHPGAKYPLIDATFPHAAFRMRSCNAFVIDRNLIDWEWSVRAVYPNDSVGPFVGPRHFSFLPCRLANGRSCYAPVQ